MDSKTLETRESIINASKEVFRKWGFNQVTMEHIAQASGMGRSSLYYYFKNKEEVFVAVAGAECLDILTKAKAKTKASQSFYDNFLAFNKERLYLLGNLKNNFQSLLKDIQENQNILYAFRKITFDQEYAIFKQMLSWGIKRHDIAPISAEDLKFLITNMIYAFKGMEQEIFLFGKVEELTNRIEWVSSIISKGLK